MREVLRALGAAALVFAAGCTVVPDAERASVAPADPVEATPPAPVAAPTARPAAPPQVAPATVPMETARSPEWTVRGEFAQGGYVRGIAPSGSVSAMMGETPLDLAEDGAFFAAFDRDSPANLLLSARLENGRTVTQTLAITQREWPTQWVNVAKRSGGSSEAWWQKRKPEWEAIQAARAQRTGANGWRQEFIWPVEARISSVFGSQRLYRGEPGNYHTGVDIAPGAGAPFVAPADGTVVLARTGFSLEGGIVIVDHGQGLNSAFLHMARVAVEEGQSVAQRDLIGTVGSTGRSTGPHLHWSLKWKDARIDPVLLVGPMGGANGD